MAGQPFDYRLNVQDPFAAATQGVNLGAGIRQLQDQRAEAERQRVIAEQKAAAEAERQRIINEGVQSFIKAPTARSAMGLSAILPPDQAKSIRESWDMLDKDNQKSTLNFSGQVLSAFKAGKPEIGINMLNEKAAAMRNAGDEQQAKAYETYAQLAEMNPETAVTSIASMIAVVPEGDTMLKAVYGAEAAPAELEKKQAEAKTAGIDAQYAETEKLLELDAIRNDMAVKRVNSQIYAMNAALSREANDLKRQELGLRIDEKRQELAQIVRDKAAKAASGQEKLDRTLNTIERIESFGDDTLGSVLGPVDSRLPTVRQKSADLEQLIEQLGSQAFLSAVAEAGSMAGMTETEGAKLQASAAQLSRAQSIPQFKANLVEFKKMLNKAKSNIAGKYGQDLQRAGEPDDIDALVNKYLPGVGQ